jgi:hypothetical protein
METNEDSTAHLLCSSSKSEVPLAGAAPPPLLPLRPPGTLGRSSPLLPLLSAEPPTAVELDTAAPAAAMSSSVALTGGAVTTVDRNQNT